jgi:hypothetical protein
MLWMSAPELASGLWTLVSRFICLYNSSPLTQAADQYPKCEVIGIDLSPGQPTLSVSDICCEVRDELMVLQCATQSQIHNR